MAIFKLKKELFEKTVLAFNTNLKNNDIENLYYCYDNAMNAIETLMKTPKFSSVRMIKNEELILFILHEYLFNIDTKSINQVEMSQIVASSIDKYFASEHFKFNANSIKKYYPPISSLKTFNNFLIEKTAKLSKNDPSSTLIFDFLYNGFLSCNSIIMLLEQGFETNAFSSWRTLHEVESILSIISNEKEVLIPAYIKHMKYSEAFKMVYDQKTTDAIFEEIKKEMKKFDLHSKDIKKYIEYGWISYSKNFDYEIHKFNFRNGVETLAKLDSYNKTYVMSSEIAHSSPFLIYSNKEYYFYLTLLNVYESFLRLEKIFNETYSTIVDENENASYAKIRFNYCSQLISNHKLITSKLKFLVKN